MYKLVTLQAPSQNATTALTLLISYLQDGATPLWIACQTGHAKVVHELLRRGASIDQSRDDGATPLFKAAHKGHLDVVTELLLHNPAPSLAVLLVSE